MAESVGSGYQPAGGSEGEVLLIDITVGSVAASDEVTFSRFEQRRGQRESVPERETESRRRRRSAVRAGVSGSPEEGSQRRGIAERWCLRRRSARISGDG